jgi:division protein CdvB (Snf7/Vps24/ESCRT-III family)
VKLSTVAIFGLGYLVGARAGRQRYDQIRQLAGRLAEEFDASGARQRLESISSRLETYAREHDTHSSADGRRAQTRA